jgi:hypothetical protein
MMKKSVSFVVALILAGSASLAIAQFRPEANNLIGIPSWNSAMPGLLATEPVPPIVNTSPPIGPSTPPPIAPSGAQLNGCDVAGCWGTDGTRYTRAGNVLFGTNGRICNIVSPGAPAICS